MMHKAVKDRGAHRVVAKIGAPVLYDAIGGDHHVRRNL